MQAVDTELATITQYTLPQILMRQSELLGSGTTAIREKAYGIWQTYSWLDYYRHVKHTGLGLSSIGLKRGENIGIVTNNMPEWLFSEIGCQSVGGVSLNLFTSSVPEELCHALGRIKASYVIAEDQEQVDKLIETRERLPHVRRVVYIDPTGMRTYRDNPWLVSFSDLLEIGEKLDRANPDLFLAELQKGRRDNVAIMIQTSGTTGISKLAMLSHRNITEMSRNWIESLPVTSGDNWISISPPAWIVDQMCGVGVALVGRMAVNFPEMPETIDEDFREIGPSIIITSSRFWEDLASRIMVKMDDAGFLRRKLFSISVEIGKKSVEMKAKGDVIHFFRAIGLNLKQCYGLTEAGGIFQVQPDSEIKLESVGKPLPRTLVKIADDQEVLVQSDSNFVGYHNDFKATEEAFSSGWLRTGDAGYIDKDGHLVIIGRKADIIKNKKGAAFSPDFIETRLKFSPYIKEAVMFGDGRPYITALINIDMGNVGNWAEERMIPYTTYIDLSQQAPVEELILGEVRKVNANLPDLMKIRKFILLYKLLDADDEELTRTGKVRRRFIYGLYLQLIEAMYAGRDEVDVKTKVQYRDGQIGEIETRVRVINVNAEG